MSIEISVHGDGKILEMEGEEAEVMNALLSGIFLSQSRQTAAENGQQVPEENVPDATTKSPIYSPSKPPSESAMPKERPSATLTGNAKTVTEKLPLLKMIRLDLLKDMVKNLKVPNDLAFLLVLLAYWNLKYCRISKLKVGDFTNLVVPSGLVSFQGKGRAFAKDMVTAALLNASIVNKYLKSHRHIKKKDLTNYTLLPEGLKVVRDFLSKRTNPTLSEYDANPLAMTEEEMDGLVSQS